jgi:uncharacterized protein with NRDE domain
MCTLALEFKPQSRWPVVVAANRDEMLDRPAKGPFVWPQGFMAPRDERAGGTWLGLTPGGLFVGVTNRFPTARDAARSSRGELVALSLEATDARGLHEQLSAVEPRRYNAFHLLYADETDAFITWSDGERLFRRVLEPGLHVVTERSFGGGDGARVAIVKSAWPRTPDADALQRLLRFKAENPIEGTYVYAPDFNYGTRSSMVLMLGAAREDSKLYWAEGQPPVPPPFVERAQLLEQVLALSAA